MDKSHQTPAPAAAVDVGSGPLLDDWNVGADGIVVKKGDTITEEDGELVHLHSDGSKTKFV